MLIQHHFPLLLKTVGIFLTVALLISVSVVIDYKSGIKKAHQRSEPILSHNIRKSITKTLHYFTFLAFGGMFDFFIILILYAYGNNTKMILPYASMLFGFIIICIEYRSVKEKAGDKLRNQMPDLLQLLQHPNFRAMLNEALKKAQEPQKPKPPTTPATTSSRKRSRKNEE